MRAGEDIGLIETAFLQLVLTELWREASTRAGDRVLDSSILKSLGGADAIVRRHVDREMTKLSDDGREIAARLFQHLVTPSGAKYALVTGDLVDLAERPTEQVLPVLKALADARLLRRIESSDRYEIFHDAFAEALLDWRKDYIQQKAQRDAALAAEQRRAAERAAERQRRRRQALIGAALMVVIGVVIYVYLERRDRLALERNNDQLKYSLEIATANAEQAEQISAAARTAQLQAEASQRAAVEGIAAERLKLEVERADFAGNKTKARDLLAQQHAASERASQAEQESTRLGEQAKAQINAAAQTQTKIDDLSKSAAQKGYDVASVGSPVTMGGPPNPTGGTGSTGSGGTGGGTPGGGETPIVPVVRGNYKAPFVDAMNAKNAKQWAVAKKALEAAIYQKNVDSGEKVIITGAGNIEPLLSALLSRARAEEPERLPGRIEGIRAVRAGQRHPERQLVQDVGPEPSGVRRQVIPKPAVRQVSHEVVERQHGSFGRQSGGVVSAGGADLVRQQIGRGRATAIDVGRQSV